MITRLVLMSGMTPTNHTSSTDCKSDLQSGINKAG